MTSKPSRAVKDRYFDRLSYFEIILAIIYFYIISFMPRKLTDFMVYLTLFFKRRGALPRL